MSGPFIINTKVKIVPPLGVAIMAGCGADLLINILLTIWLCVLHQRACATNGLAWLTTKQLVSRRHPRLLPPLCVLRPATEATSRRSPSAAGAICVQRQGAVRRVALWADVNGWLFNVYASVETGALESL